MRNLMFVIILLSIAFSFTNCTGDGNNSGNSKDVAKEICDCAQPVVDLNQEIQNLGKNGKIDEMTNLMEKAGEAMDAAIKCAKKQTTDKTNKEELQELLISTCKMDKRMANDLVEKL